MVSSHGGVNLPKVIAIRNLSHIGLPPGTIKPKALSTIKQGKKIILVLAYKIY